MKSEYYITMRDCMAVRITTHQARKNKRTSPWLFSLAVVIVTTVGVIPTFVN
ncbi:TPA: hypothetical protein ACXIB2_003313 [Proteus mirabilis]|uniref:hypothetical protein n=1 Tax=Proteus mirabilis TaxID=584 RepID=UPI001B95C44A|nr:hypothetical protein [Proteus mirabilis]HBC5903216.1 hypothetical protein [Proteus mirabilis]